MRDDGGLEVTTGSSSRQAGGVTAADGALAALLTRRARRDRWWEQCEVSGACSWTAVRAASTMSLQCCALSYTLSAQVAMDHGCLHRQQLNSTMHAAFIPAVNHGSADSSSTESRGRSAYVQPQLPEVLGMGMSCYGSVVMMVLTLT